MPGSATILDAIETKKFGGTLPEEVIRAVVEGYTSGEVPDYQMSALLMAVFTRAMAESGHPGYREDSPSMPGPGTEAFMSDLPIVASRAAFCVNSHDDHRTSTQARPTIVEGQWHQATQEPIGA